MNSDLGNFEFTGVSADGHISMQANNPENVWLLDGARNPVVTGTVFLAPVINPVTGQQHYLVLPWGEAGQFAELLHHERECARAEGGIDVNVRYEDVIKTVD